MLLGACMEGLRNRRGEKIEILHDFGWKGQNCLAMSNVMDQVCKSPTWTFLQREF